MDPRLLSKVSKLYYEHDLTQHQIAERLGLSRPRVSRLLQRARDEGIVQITVHAPAGVDAELEEAIESLYGLSEVVVVEAGEGAAQRAISREIGRAAAAYVHRTIEDGMTMGITWGTTLNAMVHALAPAALPRTQVVQIIGGLGQPEAEEHATNLCRRLAQALGSKLALLPAPGIVDDPAVRNALVADRHIRATLDLFPRLDVAFVGIGIPEAGSMLMHGTIVTPEELSDLNASGAVGDIALHFFDRSGAPLRSDLDARLIGIDPDQLRRVPRIVGMAGGPSKQEAIRAALRGGWLNVLITDRTTALWLKEHYQ